MIADSAPGEPFLDLDAYVALPRVSGLRLSPDGRRLVVGVGMPDRTTTRYVTSLWEVDPDGDRPARRLTRSGKGESAAAFNSHLPVVGSAVCAPARGPRSKEYVPSGL